MASEQVLHLVGRGAQVEVPLIAEDQASWDWLLDRSSRPAVVIRTSSAQVADGAMDTVSTHPPALLESPSMGIILSDAFLSVVAECDNSAGPWLLVRAQRQGDIERVFAAADTFHVPHANTAFRAWLPRGTPNFKDSIRDRADHDAALAAWCAMHRDHQEQLPPQPLD